MGMVFQFRYKRWFFEIMFHECFDEINIIFQNRNGSNTDRTVMTFKRESRWRRSCSLKVFLLSLKGITVTTLSISFLKNESYMSRCNRDRMYLVVCTFAPSSALLIANMTGKYFLDAKIFQSFLKQQIDDFQSKPFLPNAICDLIHKVCSIDEKNN